jgi:predicted alpha/beta superfamily hydrolase
MQDGQNLFNRSTSFAGDWGLVARLDALAADGVEAIVVGVWNAGDARLSEYSPFYDSAHGGGTGDRYVTFLADTVKPLVDRKFRTRSDPPDTGVGGSSMGALISLYAVLSKQSTFGFAVVQSPSVWFADGAILPYVESTPKGGPVYLDVGARESQRQVPDVRRLRDALLRKGYREGADLMYEEDAEGEHREAAWGRRFPHALAFLLGGRARERRTS